MRIYLRFMKECIKVKVNEKKLSVMVLGCSDQEIMTNPALVHDIVKTLGNHLGNPEMQAISDLGEVSVGSDQPDYVVKVCNGKIDVVDFI